MHSATGTDRGDGKLIFASGQTAPNRCNGVVYDIIDECEEAVSLATLRTRASPTQRSLAKRWTRRPHARRASTSAYVEIKANYEHQGCKCRLNGELLDGRY